MTTAEILKKWLQYAEYDPNQTSFNLFSTNYEMHKCCKTIAALLPYDPTGIFSIMYAKQCFVEFMRDVKVKAFDCITNPDYLAEEREMWAVFQSPEVLQAENAILDSFDVLVRKIVPVKLLGNRDVEKERAAINGAIDAIATELPKCNEDLFIRGGGIEEIHNFSTNIHVFEQLSECLLALESADDGMYVCYIRCGDSADGYFGFYIKSNGNLLSINERVNEAYPGAHSRSRNGRWAEGKKYALFPYDFIFSYGKYDYKGYASQHIINDEKLAFFNMQPEAYMPLVLAMLMLNTRYAGTQTTDMPIKFVDSLLPTNLELPTPGMNALVVPSGSALAQMHKELPVVLTTEQAKSPCYADRFIYPTDPGAPKPRPGETGSFRPSTKPAEEESFYDSYNDAPLFVELYGQEFEVKPDELLRSNMHIKRLTSTELENADPKTIIPNAEVVGTAKRMELIAYKAARDKLAAHIRQEMKKEYLAFGGKPAIESWYKDMLHQRQDRVFDLCFTAYTDGMNGVKEHYDKDLNVRLSQNDADAGTAARGTRSSLDFRYDIFGEKYLTPAGCWNGDLRCPITGAKASVYITFRIESYIGLAELLGIDVAELPKIVKGYRKHGHHGYGNSILDVTDAVTEVGTPMEDWESRRDIWKPRWAFSTGRWKDDVYEELPIPDDALPDSPNMKFDFVVGFSKRGIKQLVKNQQTVKEEMDN